MSTATTKSFKDPRKVKLFDRTKELFQTYSKFLIVNMNNITSNQLQLIKIDWMHKAEFLFGKNTTIAKALTEIGKADIAKTLKGNIAIVFSNSDMSEIKGILNSNKRDSFAKVGDVSQTDLFIQPQITSMGPEKTSFFQALNISTKITKGKVEIIAKSQTLFKEKKVSPSQANLLAIMGIKPFVYSMNIKNAYEDGEFFNPDIIDITPETIENEIASAVSSVAAMSLALGITNKATVPYEIFNEAKNAAAICLSLGIKDSKYEFLA